MSSGRIIDGCQLYSMVLAAASLLSPRREDQVKLQGMGTLMQEQRVYICAWNSSVLGRLISAGITSLLTPRLVPAGKPSTSQCLLSNALSILHTRQTPDRATTGQHTPTVHISR